MTANKIIARLCGGLGNQLFIYATARALAERSGAELVLDTHSGFATDYMYKRSYELDHFNIPCRKATGRERMEPFTRVRQSIHRKYSKLLPFGKSAFVIQRQTGFDPEFLKFRANKDVYLEGYWQSEKYFSDFESTIRNDLTISPPRDSLNIALAEEIATRQSVALHIRRFEKTAESSNGLNAPISYYKRAISIIEERVVSPHYFIFSDDKCFNAESLNISNSQFTLVKHNTDDNSAYADFWLMTKCKNFIIANSTFSWWAAWLADNSEKVVVAPDIKIEEGAALWGFDGLIPDSWTVC